MKRKIIVIVGIVLGLLLVTAAVLIMGVRFLWGRGMMGLERGLIPMMTQGGRQPFNQEYQGTFPDDRFGQNGQTWQSPNGNMPFGPGMGMNRRGGMGMNPMFGQQGIPTGDRVSMDQALSKAQDSLSSYGKNIKIAEIMEFANNFYVSVKETDSGRGAVELLVDPYSGNVSPEPGPNMMWNSKYGHLMSGGQASQSEMSVDQASQKAKDYLKKMLPTAELQTDGTAFYGYVTFDYKVNGVIAGMLSVNSYSGNVWMHTWHGTFISEKAVP
jgi:hypothetical protein